MAGSYGETTRLAVGSADPVDREIEFVGETLKKTQVFGNFNGCRGTRAHHVTRTRLTREPVGGTIQMTPNPVELAWWLQRILGGSPSGTNYPFAETIPTFAVTKTDGVEVLTYEDVAASRATFRATPGQALALDVDCVGRTEKADTFPSLSVDNGSPFVMSDLTLTVDAQTLITNNFTLVFDNRVNADRYFNALALASADATDRVVTLSLDVPYTTANTAGLVDGSGATGVAATATFTNGTVSLAFEFPAFQFPRVVPDSARGREKVVTLAGQCFRTAAAAECTITLDSTP